MRLIILAAVANNQVIGNNNQLLWHLPSDLKRFKETTMGHTMIMGRKTFESIGKPLPGRKTIVITRNEHYAANGCEVVTNLREALCKVKDECNVFVVGGGDVYRQTINLYLTRKLYITRVYANFEGDSFFPTVDCDKWELFEREDHQADEKNPYPYSFLTYKRRKG